MRKQLLLTALLLVAGCSADKSTGPMNLNVSGRWSYSASNLAGGGVSCDISGITAVLAQTGTTFTGTTTGGTMSCFGNGSSQSINIGNDIIANGKISGNAVEFDIGTSDVHHNGTVSGNSMSGTITMRLVVSTTQVILSGQFAAIKQ